MSGAEAAFVIGLISGIIAIVESTKKVYDAAKDDKGLPKAFREAAQRLPFVNHILGIVEGKVKGNSPDEALYETMEPVLGACKEKTMRLQEVFEKCIPDAKASTI